LTAPPRPLTGQNALVTGAGGDIGAALARALAAGGAAVGLVGRRGPALRQLARRLGPVPGTVFVADLTSDADVRAAVKDFLRQHGRLDVLVHSNGIHLSSPLAHAKVRDFDRLWAANVRGPFVLTQLLLPSLRASSGQIVFVNSSIGLDTRPGVGQFSATQHALRALAETLRAEANPDGIRVLNVYPGRTATKRQERIFAEEGRAYDPERLLQPDDIASIVVDALALPRTTEVTEIRIRPMLKPAR
jgi:NADP-dependent 3-hydroxy acid dehydrogenase YdfG